MVACDIAAVPRDDETLDVAVFCFSLMGSNFTDHIREAHRCLRIDGHLPRAVKNATTPAPDLLLRGRGVSS